MNGNADQGYFSYQPLQPAYLDQFRPATDPPLPMITSQLVSSLDAAQPRPQVYCMGLVACLRVLGSWQHTAIGHDNFLSKDMSPVRLFNFQQKLDLLLLSLPTVLILFSMSDGEQQLRQILISLTSVSYRSR